MPMLKILIAEDEMRIAELIQQLGHWEELNIEVADICYDGLSALESIKEKKPDIVLTDIRMPVYDGLELIQKTIEMGIHAEFIILSGYRHFEYAKSAIQQGVLDYLLKPIDEELLNQALMKACTRIQDKVNHDKKFGHERYSGGMWNRILPDSYLRETGKEWGRAEEMTLEQCNERYFTHFVSGAFRIYYVRTTIDHTLQESSVFKEHIYGLIEKIGKKDLNIEIYFADGGMFLLVNFSSGKKETERRFVSALFYGIKNLAEVYGPFDVTIGCSQYSENIENLSELAEQARMSEWGRLTFGGNKILDFRMIQNLRHFKEKDLLTEDLVVRLQKCYDFLLLDELKSLFGEIVRLSKSYSSCHPLDMLRVQKKLICLLLDRYSMNEAEREKEYRKMVLKTSAANSFGALLEKTAELLMQSFNEYIEQLRQKQQKPVVEARSYIDSAYATDITLEVVAERVGLSPAYFSKVFKQETGMGFAEYLTNVRMNVAKKKLVESRESIKVIAVEVGYTGEKYFSKVFKKVVGIKPTIYRNLYS